MIDAPIRTLYVANRGEIARRIATTAGRLGIDAVVPDLDAPGSVDLLDAGAVVGAALAARADAVHPGYGFLAESPDLAEAVIAAGIRWVGPPPSAIRAVGDKPGAREIARGAGVPVAEGEVPPDQSDASFAAAAMRIGYPVVVKPAAGGGGKGIRVVSAAASLASELGIARREARRAFADERLLVERYVTDARHVEVQVLADAHGAMVHLGDRDCSLQRRHQKVLEEAPAPALGDDVRRRIREAALKVAAAVGYVNAGTCEFLVGGDGAFVFLEMNARLQVEHPVTELVVGRDLVADQLAIASGATLGELGITQAGLDAALLVGGHAIEVRLNAEDPATGFLPSAGRVVGIRLPEGAAAFGPVGAAGVRVDGGVDVGTVVGGRFDPLLAKVIAHGPDRDAALARLAAALDDVELLGLPTNLAFLRRLVRLDVVRHAASRTDTLEREPDAVAAAAEEVVVPDGAWGAAASLLAGAPGLAGAWGGGWRTNATPRLLLEAEAGEVPVMRAVDVRVALGSAGVMAVLDGDTAHVSVDGRSVAIRLARPPSVDTAAARRSTGPSAHDSGPLDVHAPMPGLVLDLHVVAGAAVMAGDRLATLEAMKMEHAVVAPRAGVVEDVRVRAGEQVQRGTILVRLGSA